MCGKSIQGWQDRYQIDDDDDDDEFAILFLELKRLSMGLTALKSEAVDQSSVFPLQYLSKRTLLDS